MFCADFVSNGTRKKNEKKTPPPGLHQFHADVSSKMVTGARASSKTLPGHHTLFIRERHLENDNANAKNVSGYLEKCGVGNPKPLH